MRVAAIVVAALLPATLAAQGLGDAAARERKKRQEQAKPAPAKTFTEADLPSRVAPSPPGEEGSAVPDSSASSDLLDKERQERRAREAEWREKFARAREQVATAEAACWQEVVRTEFPAGIPVPMKVKEFVESDELRRAKKALADLEEEFRRTGLPPGWARER